MAEASGREGKRLVLCRVCGQRKKPYGRDSLDAALCDNDCPGYWKAPFAGNLWPSEKEAEHANGE